MLVGSYGTVGQVVLSKLGGPNKKHIIFFLLSTYFSTFSWVNQTVKMSGPTVDQENATSKFEKGFLQERIQKTPFIFFFNLVFL